MATLSWTNLNPNVEYCDTDKKFFGKYLYKAVVWCPGGQLTRNQKFTDMHFLLSERLSWHGRTYNYGGSWVTQPYTHLRRKSLQDARVEQLEYWRDAIKENKSADFKFRVEEPHISVYSNDESALYQLTAGDPRPNAVKYFFRPNGSIALNALNRGEIILKRPIDYSYRICLREGKFDVDAVKAVYQLLLSQEDSIKMTNGCKKNFQNIRYWFTSTYFYSKDTNIVTLIDLISPNMISGIFKLVFVPE